MENEELKLQPVSERVFTTPNPNLIINSINDAIAEAENKVTEGSWKGYCKIGGSSPYFFKEVNDALEEFNNSLEQVINQEIAKRYVDLLTARILTSYNELFFDGDNGDLRDLEFVKLVKCTTGILKFEIQRIVYLPSLRISFNLVKDLILDNFCKIHKNELYGIKNKALHNT